MADIVFPDVIPVRPYTVFFQAIISPSQSSFQGFNLQIDLSIGSLVLIGILVFVSMALISAGSFPLPPLIIGHGKTDTSHNKWRSKSTKRIVAKKILKSLRENNSLNGNKLLKKKDPPRQS